MMDTITVTPKSATLPSPKITKTKPPMPSNTLPPIAFGCEHLGELFANHKKVSTVQYTSIVQTIHERPGIISQTYRTNPNVDGRTVVSLRPVHMCLQCPSIMTPEAREKHYEAKKHGFTVESRQGFLYCWFCRDYIYDPTLETIRLTRGRKRKLEETTSEEDRRLIYQHSSFVPCRAIGLRGLYNMGNTCFMSVIIQTLVHNPFIRSYWLSEGHKQSECEKKDCVSCAIDEIFAEFFSLEKTEGYGAVNMLQASWANAQALVGYQQQDAHEYMQFLMNTLHNENSVSANDSENDGNCTCVIHKTFHGMLQSSITCDKCRNIVTLPEPCMDLSLDIRSQKKRKLDADSPAQNPGIELKDCLERFTSREKLASADYKCEKCAPTPTSATKQLSLKRLPPVLPIHLKRFEHELIGKTANSSKINAKVKFPLSIDMYPYTTQARTAQAGKKASASNPAEMPPTLTYELHSVIVHDGKIEGGHYISFSREKNDWFKFDDSKVTLATEAQVLDAQAYLLFYIAKALEV